MKLFYNGTIHTLDPHIPQAEALAVGDDGRIAAVGTLSALDRANVTRIDLAGRTLFPGFNDAHVHVTWLGLLLTQLVDCRIHVAPTIPAIIQRLAERARTEQAKSWVQG